MAIGNSGRIVIDLTPEQKKALHGAVRKRGKNLKQWLLEHALSDFPNETKGLIPSTCNGTDKQ